MIKHLLHALLPERCVCCGKVVPLGISVCEKCDKSLPRISVKICHGCCRPINECECAKMKRRFNGLSAPFRYEGNAKRLVRKIKYEIEPTACEYAAENMVRSLFTMFPNERFDVICFVPMSFKEENKRGANPTETLAKLISERTAVDFENLLTQTREKQLQHELPASQRRENVAGLYKCNRKLKDENVLIVDDICTTGATLNECATVLLQNGANGVWCMTIART